MTIGEVGGLRGGRLEKTHTHNFRAEVGAGGSRLGPWSPQEGAASQGSNWPSDILPPKLVGLPLTGCINGSIGVPEPPVPGAVTTCALNYLPCCLYCLSEAPGISVPGSQRWPCLKSHFSSFEKDDVSPSALYPCINKQARPPRPHSW